MKDWHKLKPELFKKNPYYLTGCDNYISMGDKKAKSDKSIFENYSRGVETARDNWVFNASRSDLEDNMRRMIDNYNQAVRNNLETGQDAPQDPRNINWSSSLVADFDNRIIAEFRPDAVRVATYRPFFKEWLYYDGMFNHRLGQLPSIFPLPSVQNRIIVVKLRISGGGHFVLMSDRIFELQTDGGTQCFPLHLYEKFTQGDTENPPLDFEEDDTKVIDGYRVKNAITNSGLKYFQDFYDDIKITKEELFYYIYGLLHSPDYRARFADSLLKELPRIPPVKKREDFIRFVQAGHKLGDLHVGYESVEPFPATVKQGDLALAVIPDPEKYFRVEKMNFGKKGKDKDRSTINYNKNITLTDIPLEAYDYVVNGKPAIEWVMERQGLSVDRYNPETKKGSDIVNDANRFANETVGDPRYPYDLLRRVITVSLETVKIVKGLPKLDI